MSIVGLACLSATTLSYARYVTLQLQKDVPNHYSEHNPLLIEYAQHIVLEMQSEKLFEIKPPLHFG